VEHLLAGLRAAAEPTRLRLLALCARAELTVSDLTQVLGQSQPRVSRHLKLLCDAGLLDRFREGAWAFYRLAQRGAGGELARRLLDMIPTDDPALALDLIRLEAVKASRAVVAAQYFGENAGSWDRIRSMHVDEAVVEAALLRAFHQVRIDDLLDIGTGTGRVLELMAPRIERGLGIDQSREMLGVARANLQRAGFNHCSVRQADLFQLPLPAESFDAVTIHQVLHFLDDPSIAVREAARVLRPGGLMVIVDFAPHQMEELRERHAHRRLGFRDSEVRDWMTAAGLIPVGDQHLPGQPLTVALWRAERPRPGAVPAPSSSSRTAALSVGPV
jgi:ubiquinone/menaquinone biosynthesis C-methylase UbiE/DNA-binding transcriptional ArsR family regulator